VRRIGRSEGCCRVAKPVLNDGTQQRQHSTLMT
jgi:hypothetical protein